MTVKDAHEIRAMRDTLEDDIQEHGWDCAVDAASQALAWVLGEPSNLRRFAEHPEAERRREWIVRGGDPEAWPEKPRPEWVSS